jgi:hypothetical protein
MTSNILWHYQSKFEYSSRTGDGSHKVAAVSFKIFLQLQLQGGNKFLADHAPQPLTRPTQETSLVTTIYVFIQVGKTLNNLSF